MLDFEIIMSGFGMNAVKLIKNIKYRNRFTHI